MTHAPLQAYVEQLLALNEKRARLLQLAQEVSALEKLARLKRERPLDEQITTFMRSLPLAQRVRPWSMADLLPHLSGKFRALPHAKEVGQALRRLGWIRERRYRDGYDGARVWIPPATQL